MQGDNLFSESIKLFEFIRSLENYQGFISILGWIAIYIFGLQINKQQLRNSARLEIYKELYQLKLNIDKVSTELGLLLWKHDLPFLDMEWAEKGSPTMKGKTPGEIWIDHNKNISEASYRFSSAYLKFWNATTAWNSIMPSLKKARGILFNELSVLSDDISKYVAFHREQMLKQHDWKKWDKSAIEAEAETIRNKFDKVAIGFVNDYMDMVHDELIQPIFNVRKVPREEFNYTEPIDAETLTKKGIEAVKYEPMYIAGLRKKSEKVKS